VRFLVDKVFLSSALVLPCQFHSTSAPYSSSSTCCSYQKDKKGAFQKQRSVGNGRALDRKVLLLSSEMLSPSLNKECIN
jgi:hypothetical protein